MTELWKVTHSFVRPLSYESGQLIYPDLGIKILISNDQITGIEHELSAEESIEEAEVVRLSFQCLSTMWEVLAFWWGDRPVFNAQYAERLSNRIATSARTGFDTCSAGGFVAGRIRLPTERTLLTANPRLGIWLQLVNEARRAATPADAIRNLYMIWEDMKGTPQSGSGTPEEELKYVRDFVSHGKALDNTRLLAFLQREFGKPVTQYDPQDPDQKQFVLARSDWARRLIEPELRKLLEDC